MIYLISPNKRQYKANLHCHSILSDGKRTPEELKEMYKSHGYSILAITDHERPANHQRLADEDFIMLTGYENYIRPDPEGRFNPYAKEVHLNLFARDPENIKMICYNESYCRYLKRDGALDTVVRAGSERPREFTTEYINEYIRTAKEHGYLVAYNHPFWSMEDEADILSYEGLFSLEIMNYGALLINGLDYAGALYDKMIRRGQRIFCHGGDDNHNKYPLDDPENDSFGAFTMIMPNEFTYGGIIDAMERGEMYASGGPEIYELSVDGDKLHIECSAVKHIYLFTGHKTLPHLHANVGESLTSADFTLSPEAKYIRITIQDERGKIADTRGFFPEEFRA